MASPLSLTDCPQCGGLCLGAVILPCGHLSCRRCCHHLLQQQGGPHITCRLCARDLPLPRECSSVSQVVQQLGADPVTDHLVQQRLLSQGRVGCQVHGNSDATMVCEDCHDYFCESCCNQHRKKKATKHHALRLLSTAVHNTSQEDCNSDNPPLRDQSENTSRDIANVVVSLQKEVKLLQQSARERHTVVSTVKEIIALGEQILGVVQAQENLLQTCTDCLSACEVTEQVNKGSYVIKCSMDDARTTVKPEALERRLHLMRDTHHSPPVTAVERIQNQLADLLHGHQDSDTQLALLAKTSVQTTPTTVTTPSKSSFSFDLPGKTPTASSSYLPPPITSFDSSTLPITHTPRSNVMTANAHKVFVATPVSAGDAKKPFICSIICTQDEKLVMTDYDNDKVKMVNMSDPHTMAASLTVKGTPLRLSLLSDGLVALTDSTTTIYLLTVTPTLAVASEIETGRRYTGVAEGLTEDTLLVSRGKLGLCPAGVDVITRAGNVLRTVMTSTRRLKLTQADYLCIAGHFVLVSEWGKHAMYKVDATTGKLVDTLTHQDLKSPRQACVDREGNIYIASGDGDCVLVRSTEGQWRRLLYAPDHTDGDHRRPYGLYVTRSGRLVVAWRTMLSHSVVAGYVLRG